MRCCPLQCCNFADCLVRCNLQIQEKLLTRTEFPLAHSLPLSARFAAHSKPHSSGAAPLAKSENYPAWRTAQVQSLRRYHQAATILKNRLRVPSPSLLLDLHFLALREQQTSTFGLDWGSTRLPLAHLPRTDFSIRQRSGVTAQIRSSAYRPSFITTGPAKMAKTSPVTATMAPPSRTRPGALCTPILPAAHALCHSTTSQSIVVERT